MKFKEKSLKNNSKLTRKQLRKQSRKNKKARKNEYYTNRIKPGKYVLNPDNNKQEAKIDVFPEKPSTNKQKSVISQPDHIDKLKKEKQQQQKLEKEMQKRRTQQLKEANVEEDRNIKSLEKQLKLNKRKTKAIPKSFASDGLDYLLEVCDSENIRDVVNAEQQLSVIDDRFEEDFELMAGRYNGDSDSDSASDISDFDDSENELEDDDVNKISKKRKLDIKQTGTKQKKVKTSDDELSVTTKDDDSENDDELLEDTSENELSDFGSEKSEDSQVKSNDNDEGTWEDIYGRLRAKDGSIIKVQEEGKYIPPAMRDKLNTGLDADNKRKEKLERLRKQLKGLINRLAERNMHSISSQIEQLYMNNSRNDMNETLTSIISESLVLQVMSPERLVLEHVMLVTILHANVGTEVGAHFLQAIVKEFNRLFLLGQTVENKMLDNTVHLLAELYNFHVFHSQLLYGILNKLSERFSEKDVECVLLILRTVGFTLRKDDPLALKNLILTLQKQANSISEETKLDNSRVKFMLDVLLAIKNNNVSKIPNYDTTYSEHLKKLLKGFVRKGNYVTQLNISLEDLLKADVNGKWWVVGSAWSGSNQNETHATEKSAKPSGYSQKLLDLARKQRMNTDARRDIFCTIMSAEDYLDAFEKLSHLGLKNQQDREIIYVILHCCLQEKKFNKYYALLVQKFCEQDRKYQMTVKCSMWDKLKALTDCSGPQMSNLAKLLIHLFVEKSLPISTLKIMEFSELDKVTLRFVRQVLLGVLLHEDADACVGVFQKIALSDKLKIFRESLRLFIHHFLLRNLKDGVIPEEQKKLLETRAEVVEKFLSVKNRSRL